MSYANMMIGFLACNILWVITSLIGFKSINSRDFVSTKRVYFTLGFIFVTRITLYVLLNYFME
jgi:hypothetical protein